MAFKRNLKNEKGTDTERKVRPTMRCSRMAKRVAQVASLKNLLKILFRLDKGSLQITKLLKTNACLYKFEVLTYGDSGWHSRLQDEISA